MALAVCPLQTGQGAHPVAELEETLQAPRELEAGSAPCPEGPPGIPEPWPVSVLCQELADPGPT